MPPAVAVLSEDSQLIEQFVELMAELEPERLESYVESVETRHLPYLLDISRKHSLIKAEAAILERQGDLAAAYDLLLARLRDAIRQLFNQADSWAHFESASQSVIDFCQRQVNTLGEKEREKIWLTLLDELLLPQREMKNTPDASVIISGSSAR